jgi:hypothetical protein
MARAILAASLPASKSSSNLLASSRVQRRLVGLEASIPLRLQLQVRPLLPALSTRGRSFSALRRVLRFQRRARRRTILDQGEYWVPLPPSAWPPPALQTMVALPDHNRPIDHQTSVLLRIRKCERTAPWQLAKINVVATKTSFWTPVRFAQCSSGFRHQSNLDQTAFADANRLVQRF